MNNLLTKKIPITAFALLLVVGMSCSHEPVVDNGSPDENTRTGEVSGEGLDELARRDSCLVYAAAMLEMYARNRAAVMADSAQYQEACQRMEEAYAYALARYQALERYVFVEGQTPFMDIMANWGYYWDKCRADLHSQYSMGELLAAVDANEAEEHADEDDEDDDISFMKSLSSRAENALLVVVCIMQLFVLACFWVVTYVGMRLACRFTRLRRFISRDKLPIVSVLTGTVLYFLVFGLLLRGDEYINLSVRHVNTFLWLLIAITGSLLLRVKPEQFRPSIQLYSATFLVVLVIIACRIIFIPDRLMNMLFPPVLLLAVLRQLYFCIKVARRPSPAASVDSTLGWVSLAIYLVAFIFSFLGYIFAALLILVWWYFLLALWLTIVCIDDLLRRYKARWVDRRVEVMRQRITYVTGEDRESLLFGATWLYDLVSQVAVPTLVLLSLPLCARLSLGIFDFDDLYVKFYEQPFMQLTDKDGTATLCVSGRSIVYLIILFFVMRYVSRAVHAVWRYVRFTAFMRKHNRTSIRVNEINLSLGNSIISALIWMAYIVVVINVWKIPTGSMGLVAGGLSAGIGLALKDTINNFIYGIQLMGGRLRVGDWIECDGVRGRVTSINYQCVQAETMEGTEMSFLNSSLFGKNFNNLTRNNSYELTTVSVGVAYGTDIGHVRRVLVEAMQQLRTKDSYGREIVDPARGVYVVVGGMNDSAVEIAVKQRVLVAERIGYVDRAKEVIYDALNAAGITIAFPQCDVHLS